MLAPAKHPASHTQQALLLVEQHLLSACHVLLGVLTIPSCLPCQHIGAQGSERFPGTTSLAPSLLLCFTFTAPSILLCNPIMVIIVIIIICLLKSTRLPLAADSCLVPPALPTAAARGLLGSQAGLLLSHPHRLIAGCKALAHIEECKHIPAMQTHVKEIYMSLPYSMPSPGVHHKS
jgi:hypothetical protein